MSPLGPTPTDTEAGPRKVEALELFSGLPRRYDELSAALSFWQDPRWRRALVDQIAPRSGERILDVATGTGMVAAELLRRADCTVVGIDQSPQMLSRARSRFAGADSSRIELVQGQAEHLPFADRSFDALSVTYLLRYVDDPSATVAELARVVRPGGTVASLEFGVPPWAPARAAWRFYTAVGLPARLRRLGARRGVSRAEHPRLLREASPGVHPRLLARGGSEGRAGAAHEPRRRRRDVGDPDRLRSVGEDVGAGPG
jgi:demethylmenaquinone methyltransferase/2-methoxy-6-polyprenyl-1,4-benzoquinol methylase